MRANHWSDLFSQNQFRDLFLPWRSYHPQCVSLQRSRNHDCLIATVRKWACKIAERAIAALQSDCFLNEMQAARHTLSLVQHAVNAYQSSQNTLCGSLDHNSKSKKKTVQMYSKNNTHKAQKIKQGQLPSKHPPLLHAIPISHSLLVNSRYRRQQSSSKLFLDDETASNSKTDFGKRDPPRTFLHPCCNVTIAVTTAKVQSRGGKLPGTALTPAVSWSHILKKSSRGKNSASPLLTKLGRSTHNWIALSV